MIAKPWVQPPNQGLSACAESMTNMQDGGLIPDEQHRQAVASHMVTVHQGMNGFTTKFQQQLRRRVYVTPKTYLDYIAAYQNTLSSKRAELTAQSNRLDGGLSKLIQVNDWQKGAERVAAHLGPHVLTWSGCKHCAAHELSLLNMFEAVKRGSAAQTCKLMPDSQGQHQAVEHQRSNHEGVMVICLRHDAPRNLQHGTMLDALCSCPSCKFSM